LAGTLFRLYLPANLPYDLASWDWQPGYSFSLQVPAVLLTAAVGGPVAGLLAQLIYVGLGLWGYPLFAEGGGMAYLQHPGIGYLLGFLPAAWVTGVLAFRRQSGLNRLATSTLMGLGIIHLCGLIGLIIHFGWGWPLLGAIQSFSLWPLLGHLIGVLLATFFAFGLRRLFFT